MLAVERKNMILTQLLLKYNADANKAGSFSFSNELKLLFRLKRKHSPFSSSETWIVRLYQNFSRWRKRRCRWSGYSKRAKWRYSYSISTTYKEGNTPLHEAAFLGFEDIVLYLLEKGASADSVNKQVFPWWKKQISKTPKGKNTPSQSCSKEPCGYCTSINWEWSLCWSWRCNS